MRGMIAVSLLLTTVQGMQQQQQRSSRTPLAYMMRSVFCSTVRIQSRMHAAHFLRCFRYSIVASAVRYAALQMMLLIATADAGRMMMRRYILFGKPAPSSRSRTIHPKELGSVGTDRVDRILLGRMPKYIGASYPSVELALSASAAASPLIPSRISSAPPPPSSLRYPDPISVKSKVRRQVLVLTCQTRGDFSRDHPGTDPRRVARSPVASPSE